MQILSDRCSPTWETHIPSDMCSPTWRDRDTVCVPLMGEYDRDNKDKDVIIIVLGSFIHSQGKPVFNLLPGLVLGLAKGLLTLLGHTCLSTQN